VKPAKLAPDGKTKVSVTVTKSGTRASDEVVQLYIHDVVSSVTRPVQELKASGGSTWPRANRSRSRRAERRRACSL
jgi:hypothetical protein